MKVTLSATLLATVVAPAFSLSYLESLNTAPATLAPPTGGLSGASAGAGASYLDALAPPASAAPSGGGMTSYLDALPKNAAPASGGSGMTSYTDALNGGAPAAPSMPSTPVDSAPAVSLDATSSSYSPEPSAPVVAGGNYLEAIAGASASGAPTGSGMTTYLDALPRASTTMGGAGIPTYTDALPTTNTVSGTGAGMATYTDNLSGGRVTSGKSFSPFSSSAGSPAFVSGNGSAMSFTLSADNLSDLLEQLRGNGGTIRLSGSIDSVQVN